MDSAELENIDDVVAFTAALPDFPNKALVLKRLETGNLNRYQEALLTLNETLAEWDNPIAAAGERPVTRAQLERLVDRISILQAQDIVAE